MATRSNHSRHSFAPRERLPQLKDSHSYGTVLALIVVLFVFADTAPTAPWATAAVLILQGLIFAIALWTSAREIERNGAALALIVSAVLAFVEIEVGHGRALGATVSIYSAVLTVGTMFVIARGVMRQREINSQSVSGAISIYVLLGIFFVFVYATIAAISHKQFFAQGTTPTRPLLLYFSFITMTTVGYGDYSPAGQVGRTFAVIEALTGQLYLVTVVAILVSQFGKEKKPR